MGLGNEGDLGPNSGEIRLGLNHHKARSNPNLMGHDEGVQNKEKSRAEAQPAWRVRLGGEVGTFAGGN